METTKKTAAGANGKPITVTVGARVPLSDYQRAMELAAQEGLTLSTWARLALQRALVEGVRDVKAA